MGQSLLDVENTKHIDDFLVENQLKATVNLSMKIHISIVSMDNISIWIKPWNQLMPLLCH